MEIGILPNGGNSINCSDNRGHTINLLDRGSTIYDDKESNLSLAEDRGKNKQIYIYDYKKSIMPEWIHSVEKYFDFYMQSNTTDNENEQSFNELYSEESHLVSVIRNCYFEFGMWTEADQYFESLIKKYESMEKPLEVLSDITNHNLADEHMLEGVLHILSNYSYEEIDPFGITISLACAVNHSPVVEDLLISCFEEWDTIDAIDILEGLDIEDSWLIDYKNSVLDKLKKKCQHVG